jgi:hypothetical protein
MTDNSTTEENTPRRITKGVTYLVIGLTILMLITMAQVLFWSYQPTNVLDIHNAPFPVRTIREHPTANGVVILKVDYCKNIDVEGRLRLSFVSQTREIFMPASRERGPVQCAEVEVPVLIPKDIPPDTYKVKFRVTYDINPLKRQVLQEFESKPVTIE